MEKAVQAGQTHKKRQPRAIGEVWDILGGQHVPGPNLDRAMAHVVDDQLSLVELGQEFRLGGRGPTLTP